MNESVGFIVGVILTLLIYSYLVGDNPLYRIAVHMLVGVSAGYAAVVIIQRVIMPVITDAQANPQLSAINWLIPLIFFLLLFLRRLPKLGWISNLALALLVGVGTAVALVGALTGTLIPQTISFAAPTATYGIIIALLTICTLVSFQFTPLLQRNVSGEQWEKPRWQRLLTQTGRLVLTITFGALFATLISTSLVLLADRINFYLTEFLRLLS
jgi:hypothetical protein